MERISKSLSKTDIDRIFDLLVVKGEQSFVSYYQSALIQYYHRWSIITSKIFKTKISNCCTII